MFLIDLTLSTGWLIMIGVFFLILFVWIAGQFTELKDGKSKETIKRLETENKIVALESNFKTVAQEQATKLFDEWKQKEWEGYKKKADEAGIATGKLFFEKWKIEHEKRIREDNSKRTIAITMGKMTEHLIPFSEEFKDFNSKDARFIGSPVDLIVFDGSADKKEEINIHFIEVKTGNAAVTEIQRKIANAIGAGRVFWKVIRREEFKWKNDV